MVRLAGGCRATFGVILGAERVFSLRGGWLQLRHRLRDYADF